MSRARDVADTQDNVGGAVAPFVAGKNIVINGGMDIWQRGTSSSSAGYVTADRWYFNANNTSAIAQETTIVPSDFRYSLKLTANSTATPYIIQSIETSNTLFYVGKVITVSFYVYASASFQINTQLLHSVTTDNAASGSWSQLSATTGGTITAGTSWQRMTATFTVPSGTKTMGVYIYPNANMSSGQSYYVTGVQLELGSVATPFSRAGGSIGGELALCQRYYWRTTGSAGGYYAMQQDATARGYNLVTDGLLKNPVPMRTVPISIDYGSGHNLEPYYGSGAAKSITTITLDTPTSIYNTGVQLSTSSAFTASTRLMWYMNNSSSTYIGVSAEL